MPPALADHGRQDGPAAQEGGAGVDAHHQVEALGRRVEEALPVEGPGVVDEQVHAAEPLAGAQPASTSRGRDTQVFAETVGPVVARSNTFSTSADLSLNASAARHSPR